jgi:peptidoglycan/LPS O-acetylase OafA/YrhL
MLVTFVIFLISIALYAFYEAPARKLLRGLWYYRQSRSSPACVASR